MGVMPLWSTQDVQCPTVSRTIAPRVASRAKHPWSCQSDRKEGWERVLVFIKRLLIMAPPLPLSPLWWVSLRSMEMRMYHLSSLSTLTARIPQIPVTINLAFDIDGGARCCLSWGSSHCSQPMELLKCIVIPEICCESPIGAGMVSRAFMVTIHFWSSVWLACSSPSVKISS